jgi:hypothetical protein
MVFIISVAPLFRKSQVGIHAYAFICTYRIHHPTSFCARDKSGPWYIPSWLFHLHRKYQVYRLSSDLVPRNQDIKTCNNFSFYCELTYWQAESSWQLLSS